MSLTFRQACDIYDELRDKKSRKTTSGDFKNEVLNQIYPDKENLDEVYINELTSKILLIFRKISRYYENKKKYKKSTNEYGGNMHFC